MRVLLASSFVEEIRQDQVRLVDLHRELSLGVPKPLARKKAGTGRGSGSQGWDKGRPWTSGLRKKPKVN